MRRQFQDQNRGEGYSPGRLRTTLLAGAAALALALAVFSPAAGAAEAGNWIGTWAASPQPVWEADFAVPTNIPRNIWNQTIRQVARISLGGSKVRIVLSNEYGTRPLTI